MANHAVPAVILAGGLGTRLRSVVADRPKVLAPVNGRPFIVYLLDQLELAHYRQVVLCTGYRSDQIEAALGSHYRSLSVSYSVEDQPLGTAGALRLALAHFDADLCLVMNGDSFVHADLPAFLAWHQQHSFAGSILLTHVDDAARYGTVDSTDDGAITGFHEKQGIAEPGWINAGIYLLPRRWLEALPAGEAISIERDCFPVWARQGLGGFRTRSPFIDIGTPESFERASAFINHFTSQPQEHS